jgi:poly(hydroxyalkanoate) depolymerase family esterase
MSLNNKLRTTLRGASKMIQSGRLMELTTAIQQSLGAIAPGATRAPAKGAPIADVIDIEARVVDDAPRRGSRHEARHEATPRQPAAEPRTARRSQDDAPSDGRFIAGNFQNAAGSRQYKLYIPANAGATPRPLLVMLHGCTQDPDDFAAGTNANAVAEQHGAYVLYPAQAQVNNMQKCWNWFQPGDQQRGQGEPSLIADMTRDVMAQYAIDPAHVFVAGLSAGGAMAVTMATTYPDLYAAAGVHSGLPHGAAHDMMSAFSAMRSGPGKSATVGTVFVPTIVFHGDKDTTVHPCNGDEVIAQSKTLAPVTVAQGQPAPDRPPSIEKGRAAGAGGHGWTRTIHRDASGATLVEHWLVHGAGHAWSGGSAKGSYTDPKGPDATSEMLRFFMDHPQRARH